MQILQTILRLTTLSLLVAGILGLSGCTTEKKDKHSSSHESSKTEIHETNAESSRVPAQAKVDDNVHKIGCSAFGVLPVTEKIYAFHLYAAFEMCNSEFGFDLNDPAMMAEFTDKIDIALQFATVESRASVMDLFDALNSSSISAWTDYQKRRTNAARQPIELYCWVTEDSLGRWLNGVIGTADPGGDQNGMRPYQVLFATSTPQDIPDIPGIIFTNLPPVTESPSEGTQWKYPGLTVERNGMGGIEDVKVTL